MLIFLKGQSIQYQYNDFDGNSKILGNTWVLPCSGTLAIARKANPLVIQTDVIYRSFFSAIFIAVWERLHVNLDGCFLCYRILQYLLFIFPTFQCFNSRILPSAPLCLMRLLMPLRALNEGKKWMYQTFAKQPLPSLGLECWEANILKRSHPKGGIWRCNNNTSSFLKQQWQKVLWCFMGDNFPNWLSW